MPTPLMKYAITKTGKGGADDWIAYAITCKSDPKTIVCIIKLRWNLRQDAKRTTYLPETEFIC